MMYKHMTTAELIALACHAPPDQHTWEDLWHRHEHLIASWLYRDLHGVENLDEIVRELMVAVGIRMFRALHTLNDPGKLVPWLSRIETNVVLDNAKLRKRYIEQEEEPLNNARVAEETPETAILQNLETEEVQGLLATAFKTLNIEARLILQMRFYEERTYREIADVLHLKHPAQAQRIFLRALKDLRAAIQAERDKPSHYGFF